MKYNILELKPDFSHYNPPDLNEIKLADNLMNLMAETMEQTFGRINTRSAEYYPIGIYIDGKSLIDIVRDIEEPFVATENETRMFDGEDTMPLQAGDYTWLPASLIYLPSQNLLGGPYDGFEMTSSDLNWGKSILLGCTCGVIDCWFLAAKITVTDDLVIWSKFGQFHRDWNYRIDPFVFEKKQYEAQLKSNV